MYTKILDYMRARPTLYAPSTAPFWDDDHISKQMLAAHMDAECDAASRRYYFIVKSAKWIADSFHSCQGARLLDLGCGPGLYCELFCRAGFHTTGVDFSKRSIDYAQRSARAHKLSIEYIYKDYMELDYENEFDVVTLIYCDFGVLPPTARRALLAKLRRALKAGGALILDGFTPHYFGKFAEGSAVEYKHNGYWSAAPYMCVQNNCLYRDSGNSLEQYIVVTAEACQCYNIWNQAFTPESLAKELTEAGFSDIDFYDDVSGAALSDTCDTICAVARGADA